jgi:hypothetical protein
MGVFRLGIAKAAIRGGARLLRGVRAASTEPQTGVRARHVGASGTARLVGDAARGEAPQPASYVEALRPWVSADVARSGFGR